ncbi:TetR/AcrR family transcriptional regulator [Agromyces sp. Leaf222]|uniref:TetR/AcrR family transcriptional regulator n=1 Tax=Agromyces sp. Leaf222 TaxID=1735688 RepID=UPI0006F5EDD9|nr:TetR/AcrR family transcriptional regulator [Agromyces sp. Leaf222]KQM80919.1 AcrR family transcriptional regulator [Agromyces sp. Leaf222]
MTQLDLPADTAAADTTTAPRLGRKRDHSRDPEILDAAIEILAETGYEGMTIEMVASRVKAGKATLYRRWPSKAELVLDAVACMKRGDLEAPLPDTGTLRGDLIALIKPRSIAEAEKKLQVMSGLASMLSRSPELADTAYATLVEPRATINRTLFQRALDRGEITGDHDLDTLSVVSAAMASYRLLMLRKPVDREFLLSIIDGVILPALGLAAGDAEATGEGEPAGRRAQG